MAQPSTSLPSSKTGYWYALLCLFILAIIVHWTADKILAVLGDAPVTNFIPAAKGLVFLAAGIILFWPVATDLVRIWRTSNWRDRLLPYAAALGVVAFSMALVFQPGPLGLGVDYSLKSVNPFVQFDDWQSTRLLMPALSYFLFLRGKWPFYGFFLAITIIFIAALVAWNKERGKLKWWEFLSLCTASFVSFQFQAPGYPDVLVYLFFLLIMRDDLRPVSKLSLLLLGLIANESSFIVGVVMAWRYLPRKEQLTYLLGIGIYVAVWVAFSNFDVTAVLASRNVDGLSGLAWVMREPWFEALGVFMGFKALWAIIVWGGAAAWRSGRRSEAGFIIVTVGAAFAMTLSAVDTSRLMGYAFPALLISIEELKRDSLGKGSVWLKILFALNLLIPSVYIGLNAGIKTFRGAYGQMYQAVRRILR